MTTNPRSRTVFENIDPDPDAILAEFDVDSPADLIDEGGAHDPIPDDELDVDDVTASELFEDLQEYETHPSQPTYRTDDSADVRLIGAESADPYEDAAPDDLEFEFVGDSDIVVREAADPVESSVSSLRALSPGESTTSALDTDATGASDSPADDATDAGDTSERSRSGTELELVGPDPTPTRISDDAFGATHPPTSSDGH